MILFSTYKFLEFCRDAIESAMNIRSNRLNSEAMINLSITFEGFLVLFVKRAEMRLTI